MPKYVKKNVSSLKQGDRVKTWDGEVIIHSCKPYNLTNWAGTFRRYEVLIAGGEKWDVSDGQSYHILYVKPEKVYKYSLDDVLFYCTFSMIGTWMVAAAVYYKWWLFSV